MGLGRVGAWGLSMAESLLDAITGGLLGVAAGDALGATVEFMEPEEIEHEHGVHREIIGGSDFKWRAGEGTDDTDLTWAVIRGYVETDSLRCAVWAIQQPDTLESVLVALVNRGNDADTTAAIAGGLLGIIHGEEGIPQRWTQQLQYAPELIEAAVKIETIRVR